MFPLFSPCAIALRRAYLFQLLLIGSLAFSCSDDEEPSSYPKTVTVEYKVTSPTLSNLNITYTGEVGNAVIVTPAILPFSVKFNRSVNQYDGSIIELGLSSPSSVTMELWIDNVIAKTSDCSNGPGAVRFCEMTYIFQ